MTAGPRRLDDLFCADAAERNNTVLFQKAVEDQGQPETLVRPRAGPTGKIWRRVTYKRRHDGLRWFNWTLRYHRKKNTFSPAPRKRLEAFFRDDLARPGAVLRCPLPWRIFCRGEDL